MLKKQKKARCFLTLGTGARWFVYPELQIPAAEQADCCHFSSSDVCTSGEFSIILASGLIHQRSHGGFQQLDERRQPEQQQPRGRKCCRGFRASGVAEEQADSEVLVLQGPLLKPRCSFACAQLLPFASAGPFIRKAWPSSVLQDNSRVKKKAVPSRAVYVSAGPQHISIPVLPLHRGGWQHSGGLGGCPGGSVSGGFQQQPFQWQITDPHCDAVQPSAVRANAWLLGQELPAGCSCHSARGVLPPEQLQKAGCWSATLRALLFVPLAGGEDRRAPQKVVSSWILARHGCKRLQPGATSIQTGAFPWHGCVCMYRNVNTQIQLGTAAYGKRLCQWQFLYGSEEIIFLANLWCLRKSQSKDMDVTFSAVCVMIERGILNAFTA
ncbi:hypothetical protein Anapl_05945 [Anas platyrhynchos]|uniref:Uncharacterized protein n=1 Tax=Anas platyrhynchos TaxID=8839 RepID=R0LVE9_ANAPL|nr:hypothetical protein Anapl_05945 [Anas platyrhynchos]